MGKRQRCDNCKWSKWQKNEEGKLALFCKDRSELTEVEVLPHWWCMVWSDI